MLPNPTPTDRSVLDAQVLHDRISICILNGNRSLLERLENIRLLDESRFYTEFSCRSIEHYLVKKHGYAGTTAWTHGNVAKALPELRRSSDAFARGELSWCALREIARIATSKTEQRWLEYARDHTADEIRAQVSSARSEGRDIPREGAYSLPAQTIKLSFSLTADQYEVIQEKLRSAQAKHGGPGDDGPFLESLIDSYLMTESEEFPSGNREGSDPSKVVVYHQCRECRASAVETEAGAVDIAPAAVDHAARTAAVITITPEDERPVPPRAIETNIPEITELHVEADTQARTDPSVEADIPTPPELRAKALARDGHRCQSCRGRRDLHAHHVHPRSDGGPTILDNLVTLCAFCHGLVHQHRLTVSGTSHRGFTFKDSRAS